MDHASPHCRVLLACTPEGDPVVRRILAPLGVEMLSAFTQEEAVDRIRNGVDVVLCSLRFDESRMLDLMSEMRDLASHPPVVCCRVLDSDLPESSLRAAFTAAGYLGAVALLSLPDLARHRGEPGAEAMLRETVAAHLHDIGHESMS